ncbi:MAG: protein translocase subunit SecF [Elusimicrobiota bacterium]
MRIFKETPTFDFIGKRAVWFVMSGVMLAASISVLLTRGLNYGIEFTGGIFVQITYESPQTLANLRGDLRKAGFEGALTQHFTGSNSFAIRIKGADDESAGVVDELIAALGAASPGMTFEVDRKEYVGPTVGRHLYRRALFAIVFSLLGIVCYVAFRFSNPLWGIAGVAALAHDVLAALGLFAALQMELDLVLVAALLTIAGYSINDSIVIFDRMREKMRVLSREPLHAVLNDSINGTISRTIITSMTTLFAVIVLLLVGGTVIHDFALTLTFGVIVGTYSSMAIAAPLVYHWEKRQQRQPPE